MGTDVSVVDVVTVSLVVVVVHMGPDVCVVGLGLGGISVVVDDSVISVGMVELGVKLVVVDGSAVVDRVVVVHMIGGVCVDGLGGDISVVMDGLVVVDGPAVLEVVVVVHMIGGVCVDVGIV